MELNTKRLIRLYFIFVLLCVVLPAAGLDGFQLSLMWPPGYKRYLGPNGEKDKVVERFTVHGLWPYKGNHRSLPQLKNVVYAAFDMSKMADKMGLLTYHWPSLDNRVSNETFWGIQWNSHGARSQHIMNQEEYFQRVLDLAQIYSFTFLDYLSEAQIIPNGQVYSVNNIEAAIQSKINVKPEIMCHQDSNGDYVLTEIRICYDANALNPIDCLKSRCKAPNGILFLSV